MVTATWKSSSKEDSITGWSIRENAKKDYSPQNGTVLKI
jgi:hypothetical protein